MNQKWPRSHTHTHWERCLWLCIIYQQPSRQFWSHSYIRNNVNTCALILTHSTDGPKNCMFETCLLISKDRPLKDVTRFNNSKSIETYNYLVHIFLSKKCRIITLMIEANAVSKRQRPALNEEIQKVDKMLYGWFKMPKQECDERERCEQLRLHRPVKLEQRILLPFNFICRLVRWTDKIPHTRCLCATHQHSSGCRFVLVLVWKCLKKSATKNKEEEETHNE